MMKVPKLPAFATRTLLAGATWWVLTDGALGWDAWVIGAPAAVIAGVLSATSLPSIGWSWRGALRFAVFFVRESLRGGVDVARRALDPRMPLAPAVLHRRIDAAPELARVAVANTSTLLPGSLVLEVEATALTFHVLDAEPPEPIELDATTARVREMFDLPAAAARRTTP